MSKLDKVLITGSSKGLGKSLAQYFFENGHEVILHGRDETALRETKHKISSEKYIDYYVCDLNNESEIFELSKFAKSKEINLLINNAGIQCANKNFLDLEKKYIEDIINTNLKAPILLMHCMLSYINGVININSMSGIETKKFRTLYASTKWGLKGFSDCLKKENQEKNILDVYPTNIKTSSKVKNGMELNYVTKSIYDSYYNNENELILDGRNENV